MTFNGTDDNESLRRTVHEKVFMKHSVKNDGKIFK